MGSCLAHTGSSLKTFMKGREKKGQMPPLRMLPVVQQPIGMPLICALTIQVKLNSVSCCTADYFEQYESQKPIK